MPTSPASPTFKRRRSSSIASSDATPIYTHSRRSSRNSISRRSSHLYGSDGAPHNRSSSSIAGDLGSPTTPTGGALYESLADELGGAWGDDEVADGSIDETSDVHGNDASSPLSPIKFDAERTRDSGIDVASSPTTEISSPILPGGHARKPSKTAAAHSRKQSRANVGQSTQNEESASDGLSPSLRASISEIETLARQGLDKDDTIDESEEPLTQFLQSLKNLGGQQATLETHSTRLITAHTSLSMHLAHQNRLLQSLAYYVLSQLPQQPLSDEAGSDLLPVLVSALETIPKPTVEALSGLHRLFVSSNELASSLTSISDTLHMSRQITSTANHRLKSAKELVAELRRENQATEQGITWIEKGHWARRLEQRECANVCKDVMGGFEQVCDSWRAKLAQGVVGA